jgi:UrcA family protein
MRVTRVSIHHPILRSSLFAVFSVGALTVLGAGARAENLDPITVDAASVQIIGRDTAIGAPIEKVTVDARIAADAETLRNPSGVVLLNDRVMEAARKACVAADPLTADDETCVRDAVKAAQPQVAAAIARATGSSVNG